MRKRVSSLPTRVAQGAGLFLGTLLALYALPGPVLGHQLNERYEAPLPLVAYVIAAALAVAVSFIFVIARNAPAPAPPGPETQRLRRVPAWLRRGLQAIGLIAWLWVAVQAIVGGAGDGDVASLFLWVYGWVGVALICALLGPLWEWLNPFATIYALLSDLAGRFGLHGGEPSEYPKQLGSWPAVIGFGVVVWLELAARIEGGRQLGLFMVAYTLYAVVGMAYYGRRTWLAQGETFSVWFGLLGRLAPYAVVEPGSGGSQVVRRPFAAGLLAARWTLADLVLVALGTGAIIFDGLSQTQLYFDLFIAPGSLGAAIVRDTILGTAFLGAIVLAVLGVARSLSVRAVGAGLLPVAVGYLVAHYLTYLLVDGQRIIAALNDPLLRGNNLLPFDLGFWEPTSFIPTSIVWSIQLAAVVGGHIVGAWSGHAALVASGSRLSAGRQAPLAALMVVLTTITLWSLGQAVIVAPAAAAAGP